MQRIRNSPVLLFSGVRERAERAIAAGRPDKALVLIEWLDEIEDQYAGQRKS